jgi:hypothetical protein
MYTIGRLTMNYGYLSVVLSPDDMQWFHQALTAIPSFQDIPADFKHMHSIQIEQSLSKRSQDVAQLKGVVEELGRRIGR